MEDFIHVQLMKYYRSSYVISTFYFNFEESRLNMVYGTKLFSLFFLYKFRVSNRVEKIIRENHAIYCLSVFFFQKQT